MTKSNIKLTLAIFVMLHLSICNLYYSCNLAFIELINKLSLNFQLISVKHYLYQNWLKAGKISRLDISHFFVYLLFQPLSGSNCNNYPSYKIKLLIKTSIVIKQWRVRTNEAQIRLAVTITSENSVSLSIYRSEWEFCNGITSKPFKCFGGRRYKLR